MSSPLYRIDADHGRFREIVRGRIRADLRRYLSTGELIGRCGEHAVSIPLPHIELPRFRYGSNEGEGGGEGGEGEEGAGKSGRGEGAGAAGQAEGHHVLEVEVELDELADMLGEELGLPRIEPRGVRELHSEGGRYTGVRAAGPDSLRNFRRSYKNALRRTIASGQWDPRRPRVVPVRDDLRYKARRSASQPDSSAVVIHMMDVSGSMGREQKEIVRIQAFWIDTWLRRQYRNLEVVYVVHDAVARAVDQHTFFHLRESGGTKISSAYELCLALVADRYRPEDWNVYPFHYSDGDNWSARDTELCTTLLRDELLPRVNQFCYSQVKSAHGSGQFKKDLDQAFPAEDALVTFGLDDRSDIPDSIRAFLGAGR
ncbi:MAG TPA: DUF444 family protein [Planctomycetota bacterium]|nr:DUF444 family protein [Planctomycetota bacterium]